MQSSGGSEGSAADSAAAALAEGLHQCRYLVLNADTETPVSAWLKLAEPSRGDFLLESVEGGRTRGRYSLIGLDPDLAFRAQGQSAELNPDWRTNRAAFSRCAKPTLAAFRDLIAGIRMDVPAGLPPALPFLVGYFGYETAGLVERLPVPTIDPLGLPDLMFVRPGLLLVFDRLADTLTLVAPVYAGKADPAAEIRAADERMETAAARLAQPLAIRRATAALPHAGELAAATPPSRYAEMVQQAQTYIAAGDIFQVVLAQRFSMDFRPDMSV